MTFPVTSRALRVRRASVSRIVLASLFFFGQLTLARSVRAETANNSGKGNPGPKNCAQAATQVRPDTSLPLVEQEKKLREVLKVCPEMAEAHANLGALLIKKKAFSEARQNYEKAFAIHEDAAFVVGLAAVALAAGDLNEAETQYQRALSFDGNSSQALQGLAYIQISRGNLAEAEQSLRKAAQLTPEDPVLFYNFGVVLGKQGKTDEAISSFRAALERKSDYLEAREQLVKNLLRQSRFDEAEQILRSALDQDNSDVLSAVMLASVLDSRGQVKQAEKILNTLEKKLPDRVKQEPLVRLSRAILKIKRGKVREGLVQLQDLEKANPSVALPSGRLEGALGWAFLQQGEVLRAVEYLKKALQENPNDQVARMNLEVANSIAGPSGAVVYSPTAQ